MAVMTVYTLCAQHSDVIATLSDCTCAMDMVWRPLPQDTASVATPLQDPLEYKDPGLRRLQGELCTLSHCMLDGPQTACQEEG